MKSTPYHPASNGLAERAVQTFKAFMKKSTTGTINAHVSRFLSRYGITPHSTTGVSPAEMLLGRRPRTRLDLLRPDINNRVQLRKQSQKWHHDQKARERKFQRGDNVSVRNFADNTWIPGVIEELSGPLPCHVKLQDGRIVRRHTDHMLAHPRADPPTTPITSDDCMNLSDISHDPVSAVSQPNVSLQPPLRRSTRQSIPPKHYGQT